MAMSQDKCFALLEADEDVLQVQTAIANDGVVIIDKDSSEEATIFVPAYRIDSLIELLTEAQIHLQGRAK